MMNQNFVIGLTGRFGAGSTTTANLILSRKENDFVYFSLSDFIKETAKKQRGFLKKKEKEKRVALQDIGDTFRKKDPSFLVNKKLQDIKRKLTKKNVLVDSIRNDKEVDALRNNFPNFFLFAIDASTESRWQRLKKLYGDDRGQFDLDDKRDAGGEEEPSNGQQVKKCMEIADVLINNDRNYSETQGADPVEEYGQKIERYIKLIKNPGFKDPNFDELYMHHACSVALRSLCRKRQVGAVIVKEAKKFIKGKLEDAPREVVENFLLASGCNNVPIGDYPCGFEKGSKDCYRDLCKKQYIKESKYCRKCGHKLSGELSKCKSCGERIWNVPGKILDLCKAIHAEEAAIIQAAKLGIAIDETMLYTSTFPCALCSKKIVGSGIKKIIYLEPYPMKDSLEILQRCDTLVNKYEGVNSRAFVRLFLREIEDEKGGLK